MNGHGAHGPADDATRKYCYTALANEKHRLATAPKGGRNAALNNAALALGHLAHYGAFNEDEARVSLRNACTDNGLIGDDGQASFETTFASGWAKGLSERRIVYRHALRNALVPVVTVVGLQFGSLLAGAIVTETIFSLPGIGRLTVSAISNRDYALVQGCILAIGLTYVVVNLLTDLAYTVANPRMRA